MTNNKTNNIVSDTNSDFVSEQSVKQEKKIIKKKKIYNKEIDLNTKSKGNFESDLEFKKNNKDFKCIIYTYPNEKKIIEKCKTFENKEITINASFMNKNINISNCNAFGNIFEDIFYSIIKDDFVDIIEGPKQTSPDFYGDNKKQEFELKTFTLHPGFDIGNFTSFINQICEENGIFKKILNTKYLVFEYTTNKKIKIKKFHYLNIWNLVSYSGKYPISMQVKKNMWYNIRPDSVKNWYDKDKSFHIFITNILKCINECHHIEDKEKKINSIKKQYKELIIKYTL